MYYSLSFFAEDAESEGVSSVALGAGIGGGLVGIIVFAVCVVFTAVGSVVLCRRYGPKNSSNG